MKGIRNLPLSPRRQDFANEADYQYAKEHWDELTLQAEDAAMERYYEKKYSHEKY